MALERYREKRNFRITPEPRGKVARRRSKALAFVVQKHAATRLHYDFRLELDGVMLSWAVPKGPSLDPNDKRLAMHTEDHPLEYGDFEGVIPPRQYGAGTVMVWDRGTWTPKDDPREGYAKGKLKFELHGEKLEGGWNLVRSRGGKYASASGESWLLIKEADDFARLSSQARVVDDMPDSVASGRSLEEIAADSDRVWHSNKSVAENVAAGAVADRSKAGSRRRRPVAGLDRIEGSRKQALPKLLEPQLATLVKSAPTGAGWVHEIKHDGYRMLARVADGEAHLFSRNGNDWSGDFPAIVRALARLPVGRAWLDGEVVVLDARGRSSFQALQNALSAGASPNLVYYAFDLLHLDGRDLREAPLLKRKEVLQKVLVGAPACIRYNEHFDVPGDQFLHRACSLGAEGMVSKRADLAYRPGRSSLWQKVKCLRRQEMVVGGFTDPGGSRQGFGALLLGIYEAGGTLRYAGKVGTGFNEAALAELAPKLRRLEQKQPAFADPPRGAEARGVHWTRPSLVAEVAFTEWTDDGTLRHPSFCGLRTDKPPESVVREVEGDGGDGEPAKPRRTTSSESTARRTTSSAAKGAERRGDEASPGATRARRARAASPASSPSSSSASARDGDRDRDGNVVAGIALSNPDKLLYPESRLSKRDLARYYEAVGRWMVPHFRDRPLTLVRCPNGWDKACFYQKNADQSASDAISRVPITLSDGSESLYMMANSVGAIVALLQLGALELHPWGSRADRLDRPDRIVFDLDPDEAVGWEDLRKAALIVKALVESVGLVPFVKTTGGKGLHVVVPIEPSLDWEPVKGFTKAVAELLERTFPDRFTSKLLKVSRRGRIFIDYLRNSEGATAVGPYSIRAKAQAPVATPIDWKELDADVRFAHFNVGNVPARLAKAKRDPWADMERRARALTPQAMAKVGYRA